MIVVISIAHTNNVQVHNKTLCRYFKIDILLHGLLKGNSKILGIKRCTQVNKTSWSTTCYLNGINLREIKKNFFKQRIGRSTFHTHLIREANNPHDDLSALLRCSENKSESKTADWNNNGITMLKLTSFRQQQSQENIRIYVSKNNARTYRKIRHIFVKKRKHIICLHSVHFVYEQIVYLLYLYMLNACNLHI